MATGSMTFGPEVTSHVTKDGGRPCLRRSNDLTKMADDIISADIVTPKLTLTSDM